MNSRDTVAKRFDELLNDYLQAHGGLLYIVGTHDADFERTRELKQQKFDALRDYVLGLAGQTTTPADDSAGNTVQLTVKLPYSLFHRTMLAQKEGTIDQKLCAQLERALETKNGTQSFEDGIRYACEVISDVLDNPSAETPHTNHDFGCLPNVVWRLKNLVQSSRDPKHAEAAYENGQRRAVDVYQQVRSSPDIMPTYLDTDTATLKTASNELRYALLDHKSTMTSAAMAAYKRGQKRAATMLNQLLGRKLDTIPFVPDDTPALRGAVTALHTKLRALQPLADQRAAEFRAGHKEGVYRVSDLVNRAINAPYDQPVYSETDNAHLRVTVDRVRELAQRADRGTQLLRTMKITIEKWKEQ